jgi:hypothetical protein
MEANFYMYYFLSVLGAGGLLALSAIIIIGVINSQMLKIEKQRKEDHAISQSFLRHMHIESLKNSRKAMRILNGVQKTNEDNAIFLRMIFERVDKPPQSDGSG